MAKMIKGDSSRKPPEPADGHDVIEEWISKQRPDLQPILKKVDAALQAALPHPQYAVKWKKAFYGTSDRGWVVELVSYDVSVNVGFHGGADLDDPPPLGEGRYRYVKLKSVDEIDDQVTGWIENAAKVDGWK